ncbi:endonuclease/exonuclease/phosphatase family protein [Lachnospiraceae bacterium 62-26]
MGKRIDILSLNIGNPSLERAKRQCDWLKERSEDVFVLTETRESQGCGYIKEYFRQYGYDLFSMGTSLGYSVNAPISRTGELGVIIISRCKIRSNVSFFSEESIYFSRMVESVIKAGERELDIVGLYVPSRDRSDAKIRRKREFIDGVIKYLDRSRRKNRIIIGDFNVLDRKHIPHYSNYFEWEYGFFDQLETLGYVDAFRYLYPDGQEYSWVGRTDDGYRYDHCFVSVELKEHLLNCEYIHETRKLRLTDHSAITLGLAIE